MKKRLILLLALAFALTGCKSSDCTCEECKECPAVEAKLDKNLAILYTNDVHCQVGDDKTLGYAELSQCKKDLLAEGNYASLVDCGDAIQGNTIGTISKGLYITEIMNEVGYDVAIPGNHEFDYGMSTFLDLTKEAKFPYVSANFMNLKTNKTVLEPYVIKEYDDVKIAYVGMTTPTTITSSTPAYFKDADGNFIYGFFQGDGSELYKSVQTAVDSARNEGADYVIALSHLGSTADLSPYMSEELIKNTNGIDVVLDGHSHSVIEGDRVKNKDGDRVLLSSTGTQFQSFGMLYINKDGSMSTGLIKEYDTKDAVISDYIAKIQAEFNEKLNEVVGKTDYDLTILDPETKKRIVRKQETNLGDLCVDSFRYTTDADIAIVNGGGVRKDIPKGNITYGQAIAALAFSNQLCMVKASGQSILDCLEFGAYKLPEEFGGFLQVSGIKFDIDTTIATPVVVDSNNILKEITGERRIKNVYVGDTLLDKDKIYTVAGANYTILNEGDGNTCLKDSEIIAKDISIDNQALVNYIRDELNGTIPEKYSNAYGDGRINILA